MMRVHQIGPTLGEGRRYFERAALTPLADGNVHQAIEGSRDPRTRDFDSG